MESLNFCTELTDYEAINVVGGAIATSSGSNSAKLGGSSAFARYSSLATGNFASASGSNNVSALPGKSSSGSNSQACSGSVICL